MKLPVIVTVILFFLCVGCNQGGGRDAPPPSREESPDLAFDAEVFLGPDGTADVSVDVFGNFALGELVQVRIAHPSGEWSVAGEGTLFSFHRLPPDGLAEISVCLTFVPVCVVGFVDLSSGLWSFDPTCDPRNRLVVDTLDLGLPALTAVGNVAAVRFRSDEVQVDADLDHLAVVVRPPGMVPGEETEFVLLDGEGVEIDFDAPGLWVFEPRLVLTLDCGIPPLTASVSLDQVVVEVEDA